MERFNKRFLEQFCLDINLQSLGKNKKEIFDFLDSKKDIQNIEENAKKIKINSIILVKNQENYIKNAVMSALQTSDYTYVFDTGSTDKTVDIITESFENEPVMIKHIKWKENYAYMRNLAAKYVPDGWILVLDSDEIISPDVNLSYLKLLLAFLDFLFSSKDISITFKQEAIGMNAFSWPERMYRKRNSIRFYGYVHEELRSDQLITIQTSFTVKNQGTSEFETSKFNKQERYFQLSLKNYDAEPNNTKWLALMPIIEALNANEDWYLGELEKNIQRILKNKNKSLYDVYILVASSI